jgi:hypothetical protein
MFLQTSVHRSVTRSHIPGDGIHHSHRHENLISVQEFGYSSGYRVEVYPSNKRKYDLQLAYQRFYTISGYDFYVVQ